MRAQKNRPVPHFVSLRDFCRSIGLYHALANRLLALGVLEPDGLLNSKPIFSADIATYEKARFAVSNYRRRQNRAVQEVKEGVYV
jgi:hypothetical protein